MDAEQWIVASSTSGKEYYPNNLPYKFSIHLNEPLDIEGEWTISLREFYATTNFVKRKSPPKRDSTGLSLPNAMAFMLHVHCSICEIGRAHV